MNKIWQLGALALLGTAVCVVEGTAQRVQLPGPSTGTFPGGAANTPPTLTQPPVMGGTFDPYAGQTGGGSLFGAPPPAVGGGMLPPQTLGPPQTYAPAAPPGAYPQGYPAAPVGPGAYPTQGPSGMFPGGFPQAWDTCGGWTVAAPPPYERLIQDTSLTHTWLAGDGGAQVDWHAIDLQSSLVLYPNFFYTQSPLRFTPGFTLHLLDGPSPPVASDLPPQLYSAYGIVSWNPQLTPRLGAELSVGVGVYSDFEGVSSDSVRITGTGAGVINFTDRFAVKLGVTYLDRLDIKLLPVVGFVYRPNPYRRYDIVFPEPRASMFLATFGAHNTELWGYVGAEYGGGNWTIERETGPLAGRTDRVDLNDIRIFLGVEWKMMQASGPHGFFEVGYVFERELVYALDPATDNVSLDDTVMLRTGISF